MHVLGYVTYADPSLVAEKDLIVDWMSKLGEKAEGIRGHGKLQPLPS